MSPKNPGCPIFGVGMPHAWSSGDALTSLACIENDWPNFLFFVKESALRATSNTSQEP